MTLSITLIVLGIVVLLGVLFFTYCIYLYNSLVQVRNNVNKAFKNIDVLLMQRNDELPKLIDTCKGYMKYESEILDSLTSLREHYAQAKTTAEKTGIENEINKQYLTLAGRWEAYPELKASASFNQIQERISGLESTISDRREFFNDSVNIYNIRIERFPDLILAGMLKYSRKDFLEVPEEKKQDVKVDFS